MDVSQVVMSFLSAMLTLVSTIGNGSFIAIFNRFKNLRNFPNILFASLAVVDFANALINVPLFVLYFVMKPSWLKGKTLAIISSSLHLDFTLLNIVSMFALMVDRFLALYLVLKYLTWKTTKRAYFAVLLIWLGCTMVVAIVAIPLFDMDFDNQTLKESRVIIFNQRKRFVASIMATFVTAACDWILNELHNLPEEKPGKRSAISSFICLILSVHLSNHETVFNLKKRLKKRKM